MKVTLVATGGTIASTASGDDGAAPDLDATELAASVPEVDGVDEIAAETFSTVPSNHMTIDRMWELAEFVRDLQSRTDAVVVMHGTDTLEEHAYFLDLCYGGEMPVVFTGAMRAASDPGPDGPRNVEASLRAVASDRAAGEGVLVALNDRVYPARSATKAHTSAVDAFESPEFGPLAVVEASGITWRRSRVDSETYDPDPSALTSDVLPVTVTADHPASHLRSGVDSDAVCLATLGAGHVPPDLVPAIEDLRAAEVPVVATTRCRAGRLARSTYDYPGSEQVLHDLGCFVTDLPLPKARIKTIVAGAADHLDDAFDCY